jgi:hypothetical protein
MLSKNDMRVFGDKKNFFKLKSGHGRIFIIMLVVFGCLSYISEDEFSFVRLVSEMTKKFKPEKYENKTKFSGIFNF